jgi:hypothetical protein
MLMYIRISVLIKRLHVYNNENIAKAMGRMPVAINRIELII